MRKLIKTLLPKPVYDVTKGAFERITYRARPRAEGHESAPAGVLKCAIAYNKYGAYCVPLSGRRRVAAQRIFAGRVWEQDTIEFLIANIGAGDIVHAGTFFGDFVPALSRACQPGAKVWAFEPNPESFRCAQLTLELNGLANVVITNAGLGEREAMMSVVTTDDNGNSLGGLSRIENHAPDASSQPVRIVAVDEIVPADRRVSIIQLDVEGFERPALTGALETIRRCRPLVLVESPPEQKWLEENVLSLGYRVDGDVHDNVILRPT